MLKSREKRKVNFHKNYDKVLSILCMAHYHSFTTTNKKVSMRGFVLHHLPAPFLKTVSFREQSQKDTRMCAPKGFFCSHRLLFFKGQTPLAMWNIGGKQERTLNLEFFTLYKLKKKTWFSLKMERGAFF